MPLNADNRTIPFSLEVDALLPLETRPVFHLKFLTHNEDKTARELMKPAFTAKDDATIEESLDKTIRFGVVRLENVRLKDQPVTQDAVPHTYLTTGELWELAQAVLSKPIEEEKRLREEARAKKESAKA